MRKYFSIVRVFPTVTDVFNWSSMRSEFEVMDTYEIWLNQRMKKLIKEDLEVYVKTDIEEGEALESVRHDLTAAVYATLNAGLIEAEKKWRESNQTTDDWLTWQDEKVIARESADKQFTEYIKANYTKLEIPE